MMKLFQQILLVIHIHQFLMLKLVFHSMIILSNLFHGMFLFINIFLIKYNYFLFRYDNEYGYSNRVVDLIKYIAKKDHGK